MRKRKSSDNSTRKARSSPERGSTPAGHTAVGDVPSSRHQAAMTPTKPGEETRPERDYEGWEPMVPLIRLPSHAETASPRKGKLKAHSLYRQGLQREEPVSGAAKASFRSWRAFSASPVPSRPKSMRAYQRRTSGCSMRWGISCTCLSAFSKCASACGHCWPHEAAMPATFSMGPRSNRKTISGSSFSCIRG